MRLSINAFFCSLLLSLKCRTAIEHPAIVQSDTLEPLAQRLLPATRGRHKILVSAVPVRLDEVPIAQRHTRFPARHAQGATEDCSKSLRFNPGNVLALGTRADAKRLAGDLKVPTQHLCTSLSLRHVYAASTMTAWPQFQNEPGFGRPTLVILLQPVQFARLRDVLAYCRVAMSGRAHSRTATRQCARTPRMRTRCGGWASSSSSRGMFRCTSSARR